MVESSLKQLENRVICALTPGKQFVFVAINLRRLCDCVDQGLVVDLAGQFE